MPSSARKFCHLSPRRAGRLISAVLLVLKIKQARAQVFAGPKFLQIHKLGVQPAQERDSVLWASKYRTYFWKSNVLYSMLPIFGMLSSPLPLGPCLGKIQTTDIINLSVYLGFLQVKQYLQVKQHFLKNFTEEFYWCLPQLSLNVCSLKR